MNDGEKIGTAWNAAVDRLPDGWIIDKLELQPTAPWTMPDGEITQGRNVWFAHARPMMNFAWKKARMKHLREGYKGRGLSAVEALLDLALRAEAGDVERAPRKQQMAAVDRLFETLFT